MVQNGLVFGFGTERNGKMAYLRGVQDAAMPE
jgi:hypothetical protein